MDGSKLDYAGQIETYLTGAWKKVSFTRWNDKVAGMVCNQLGYNGVEAALHGNAFGTVNSSISIDCHGNESKLDDCRIAFGTGYGSAVLCTPTISKHLFTLN